MPFKKRSFIEIEDFKDAQLNDLSYATKKANISTFQDFDVNYFETLSNIIPSSIPQHLLLGGGKQKLPNEKEQCLYEKFSNTLADRYVTENPILLLNKYEEIMTDFSSSLVRMISNGFQIPINEDEMKPLIDICNISFYQMNTWILLKFMIIEFFDENSSEEGGLNLYEKIHGLLFGNGAIKYYNSLARWLEKCCNIRNKDINLHDIKMLSDTTGYRYASQKFLILHESNLKNVKDCIATELDPDAPQRLNLPLIQEDLNNENSFYYVLFRMLRCGQADQFIHLCRHSGQLWRTLTLLNLRNIITKKHSDDNEKCAFSRSLEYYDLWRESAWKLSNDSKSNIYERAIYGVLAGNVDAVLPVCETFEDYLWANLVFYITTSIQTLIFNELKCNDYIPHDLYNLKERYCSFNINTLWNEGTLSKESIPFLFHSLQRLLITKKTHIDSELEAYVKLWSDHSLIMLFLVHFVILYKSIVLIKDSTYSLIINSYIRCLVRLKKFHLIPMYTSYLPSMYQIDSFVSVLKQIKPSADKSSFIKSAKNNGLDYIQICKKISFTVVDDYLQYIKRINSKLIDPEETKYVLDALDFSLLKPKTYLHASFLILRLTEYFIINDNFSLGSLFFKKIPISVFAVLKKDMLSYSGTTIPLEYFLTLKKYKYLHRLLDLEQLILSFVNTFDLKQTSEFEFISPSITQDLLLNSPNFEDITQRLITECTKLIKYSIKWMNSLSNHDFSKCINQIPYSDNIYYSESLKLVQKFTSKIINIIYNIHHCRNDHIKCLQVSHFVVDLPTSILESFNEHQIKELLDKCSDCFTLIDFSNK